MLHAFLAYPVIATLFSSFLIWSVSDISVTPKLTDFCPVVLQEAVRTYVYILIIFWKQIILRADCNLLAILGRYYDL
jgi:hypothetical protein